MPDDLQSSPCERMCRGAVPSERPFVAVAVKLSRRYGQWHAGLAYCDAEDPAPRFLHLAWDREIKDEPLDDEELGWDQSYLWIEIQAPLAKRRALAQLCRRIAERVRVHGQTVRYAVRYHLGSFDPQTGAHVPAAGELGLTCATCVLAICRGVELELVDIPTWPVRREDEAWFQRIVGYLQRADAEWARAVAEDGLCPRFRPNEVAGAALSPFGKVPFAGALAVAELLDRRYEDLFPAVID